MHTACTPELTLLAARAGRGRAAMDDIGVLPDFAGVAVHDGFLPCRTYPARHALGNAHHVLELVAVTERDPAQTWAADRIDLLTAANSAAHRACGEGLPALTAAELADLHYRYGDLVAAGLAMNPPPPPTGKRGAPKLGHTGSLLRRRDQRSEEVLRFDDDLDVPDTNNQAERDLRITKVQTKISGCWRTMAGAKTYASLRSYASTIWQERHQRPRRAHPPHQRPLAARHQLNPPQTGSPHLSSHSARPMPHPARLPSLGEINWRDPLVRADLLRAAVVVGRWASAGMRVDTRQ